MVDAEDLKSFDHCDRVGSSPTIPTKLDVRVLCGFFIFREYYYKFFVEFLVVENHVLHRPSLYLL